MNLIVGATGVLGSEICRLLAETGKPFRVMVRNLFDNSKTHKLRTMGAQLVQGDLTNRKTLGPALKGIQSVIVTASAVPSSYVRDENDIDAVDKNGMMDLIEEAVQAKVQRFIYTSFSGNIDGQFPLRNAKRTVEQHLRNSGLTFTILRPGFFMESWLSSGTGFDVFNGKVQIYGTGTQPVSYISYYDVAQFAVASVNNPLAVNSILELGGPEKLTQLDVVRIFEDIHGRQFNLDNLTEEQIRTMMNSTTDPMERSMAGLMLYLAKGDPIDMKSTLKGFRIKLRSVRDFALRSVPAQ